MQDHKACRKYKMTLVCSSRHSCLWLFHACAQAKSWVSGCIWTVWPLCWSLTFIQARRLYVHPICKSWFMHRILGFSSAHVRLSSNALSVCQQGAFFFLRIILHSPALTNRRWLCQEERAQKTKRTDKYCCQNWYLYVQLCSLTKSFSFCRILSSLFCAVVSRQNMSCRTSSHR